jgi:hypothetical protein
MGKRYYIAYGSNLNVTQMRYRCPAARIAGTTMLTGFELLYKGSKTGAYLTIEEKKGGRVPVAIWEVTASDEKNLDRYEGFPNFYYKKEFQLAIRGLDGETKKVRAFAYIMHEERKTGIPTWNYVECCKDGYDDFGFDPAYLDAAYERSARIYEKH